MENNNVTPQAPPKTSERNNNRGKGGQSSSQSERANAEDGVHTSRRSRVSNSTTESETNSKPKAPRGTISNKVTKPNGRGDTLREAVETKKS